MRTPCTTDTHIVTTNAHTLNRKYYVIHFSTFYDNCYSKPIKAQNTLKRDV